MITGIKFACHPTDAQKEILSQWMGCARFIWNAKCDEDRYLRSFARRYLPVGTFPKIDQSYSQYKTELTPWLSEVPSQILRNSVVTWYSTYQNFLKGRCGRPQHKRKDGSGSLRLTRELFQLERANSGTWTLWVGTKTRPLGKLAFTAHRGFKAPNSIYIRREKSRYFASFCYEDEVEEMPSREEHLEALRAKDVGGWETSVCGIDRGIAIPIQTQKQSYRLDRGQEKNKRRHERQIKRLQRRLSKQIKGSHRREKTKRRLGQHHAKSANIRHDFCHKASRSLADSAYRVFIIEDLSTRNMTRSAKGTVEQPGKRVKAKSGLNRAILDQGWHLFASCLAYKAHRASKVVFKAAPHHTSQECAQCGHTHPSNRTTQSEFHCVACGHTDNADRNAACVIAKRGISLIKDSGAELLDSGLLMPPSSTGRGGGISNRTNPPAKRQKRQAAIAV